MTDVEVPGATRGDTDDPRLDGRDELVLPGRAAIGVATFLAVVLLPAIRY